MNQSIYAAGPQKQAFKVPAFVSPGITGLDNGVPVYSVLSDETETLKIEWVFEAGSIYAQKVMQASVCAELLNKGTASKNAYALNEALDYYGSYFSADSGRDELTLRLFTLKRFLPEVLPIVAEMFTSAIFPEHEFAIWLDARKSAFGINSKKTDYVASARFPSVIFGENTLYGVYVKPAHFDLLQLEDAVAFHARLLETPFKIFVSGNVPSGWEALLNAHFGNLKPRSAQSLSVMDDATKSSDLHIPVENSVQHSLIIGKRLWVREVEEYTRFMVMNTALGGYFGSRLMANLREKNGYTYGVGSGLSRMQFSDVFKISTDVGAEISADARREIAHEIEVLQTEHLAADELQRVKTYMSGSFLRSFDGPQAIMDRYKSLIQYGLPLDFFARYAAGIQDVSAEAIRETAQQYLSGLSTVVAGK